MSTIATYSHNVSGEKEFGFAQAIKAGDTIYVSGQLSHDAQGEFLFADDLGSQFHQVWANLNKVLTHFGASRNQIVSFGRNNGMEGFCKGSDLSNEGRSLERGSSSRGDRTRHRHRKICAFIIQGCDQPLSARKGVCAGRDTPRVVGGQPADMAGCGLPTRALGTPWHLRSVR